VQSHLRCFSQGETHTSSDRPAFPRWAPSPKGVTLDEPDPSWQGRYQVTAHHCSALSGSVEITHPFHPLRGQRFSILKSRRVRGVECLVLKGSAAGTFAVPRAWTDRAEPDPYHEAQIAPRLLKLESLILVAELLPALANSPLNGGS
jgi:hypothetical protein